MADMGLFGLPFPEEYGGMGGDYFALCLALEELGKVDQSVAITLEAGVSLGAMPVYRFGNEAQKQEWLPLLTSGKALAGVRAHRSRRRQRRGRHQDHRELDDGRVGHQRHQAVHHQLRHRHHPAGHRHRGHRRGATDEAGDQLDTGAGPIAGFTAEPAYDKVGWNASDTHPLSFDDVRVPEENLLGERGRGYANFLRILDEGRIAIAALSVGAAQGCVDEACATPRSARRSASRSARTRPSSSRSPAWRPARTPPAPPTTTRPR